MTRRNLLCCLLLCAAGAAAAGSLNGRNLVWVYLGTGPAQAVDAAVQAVFDGPDDDCWGSDTLVYMRKRPPGITPSLVRRALVLREPRAQHALRAVLRRPFDEATSFDGVIAYVDKPQPRLVSLAIGGRLRSGWVREASGEPAWQPSLCEVMPPVARKP